MQLTDWDPVPSGIAALFHRALRYQREVKRSQSSIIARGEQRELAIAAGATKRLSRKVGWDLGQTLGFLLALSLPRGLRSLLSQRASGISGEPLRPRRVPDALWAGP